MILLQWEFDFFNKITPNHTNNLFYFSFIGYMKYSLLLISTIMYLF